MKKRKDANMDKVKIHPFEEAGLGKAPFECVGVVRKIGPLQVGPDSFAGAPGQPMGTCAYCFTGIAECCQIKSADGQSFEVGNVCVGKTDDGRLMYNTRLAVQKHRGEHRRQRETERIDAAKKLLEDPAIWDALKGQPHPIDYMAARGLMLFDWARWMMENAGRAGQMRVARVLEKAKEGMTK